MAATALLADIGGTNTRVALAEDGRLMPGSARRFRNADFPALEPLLRRFMDEGGVTTPQAACLAMAGPVRDGVGQLTNLDWTLNTALLSDATGAATVALLNDLQAQGHALGHLPDTACQPILAGQPVAGGAQLVIGVGTGFNMAPVFETPGGRYVPPSEAGHASLPVHGPEAESLARYLSASHGFSSIEDALSGRGLGHIHGWCAAEAGGGPKRDSAEVMQAFDQGDVLAQAAVRAFATMLGRVAGDLALNQLPFGGIYLIGGMSRVMAPHLVDQGFAAAFRDKGRFTDFMDQFSVAIVTDDDAALIGSAQYLKALMAQG